ncbi:MAG TPA: aspartyl protease family protein [Terracidiphilus sp.]|jgi:predicted aspartyl protease|nr:aspartyl protease family protein [Terracidiphilus sp.]
MRVSNIRNLALLVVVGGGLASGCVAAQSIAGRDDTGTHQTPMLERYGKPYIQVTINGRGPFRFVIDTGTGGDALVTPELAKTLGLPAVGQSTLSDPSGQGGKKAPVVLIDSLELAGVEFKGVRAVSHPFFSEAGTCDGLLGFTIFRDYLLTLDFPNRMVMLSKGALAPDGGKAVLPFRMPEGVPLAILKVDGLSPVEAQLDSGGGGLVLPEKLAERLKYDVSPVVFATGRSVSTRFELKAAKLASDVKLGRYTFTHPVVEIHPAFPLVNFGSPPMQIFAITFDQKNLLVRFDSNLRRFSLNAPPCPTRLTNAPEVEPRNEALVPVG